MYAFSQISAGGHKLSQVVSALEQDIKKPPTTNDEDDAILAFSNTLPGNDDAPVEKKVDPAALAQQKKAEQTLSDLQSNPNTAALASLVDSGAISLA